MVAFETAVRIGSDLVRGPVSVMPALPAKGERAPLDDDAGDPSEY
jgi:hypothetical protein